MSSARTSSLPPSAPPAEPPARVGVRTPQDATQPVFQPRFIKDDATDEVPLPAGVAVLPPPALTLDHEDTALLDAPTRNLPVRPVEYPAAPQPPEAAPQALGGSPPMTPEEVDDTPTQMMHATRLHLELRRVKELPPPPEDQRAWIPVVSNDDLPSAVRRTRQRLAAAVILLLAVAAWALWT